MQFTKPPLSVSDQVELLQSRGMIGQPDVMAERLTVVSYYRLTAYWHPFRLRDRSFCPGTSFDTVWDRYVFDRHLRLLVMDAIERIEVAVRTALALEHSLAHGPFAYIEQPASLPQLRPDQRMRFEQELASQYRRSQETFVQHFQSNYGGCHQHLPTWMAIEIMSFGSMLTFYRGCHNDIKRLVAAIFKVHHQVFESWLMALNVVRNICAHHGRLWNRVLGVKPTIPKRQPMWHKPVVVRNDRVFGILTICKYCLDQIAPQSNWPCRLRDLLHRFCEPPRADMGIPHNWLDCPVWSTLGTTERAP